MQVERAFVALDALPGTSLVRRSGLYLTPPWGFVEQPDFINAVAELETVRKPLDLLQDLQAIEKAQGRERSGLRWGPRTLDLDLLLYDQRQIDDGSLQLPHPRLGQRPFVLLPLAEIAPELEVPGLGRVRELLARTGADACRRVA